MKYLMTVILTILILIVSGFIGYIEVIYENKLRKTENNNPKILKILQEVACDYRVRVIKAGFGNIKLINDKNEQGYINLGADNSRQGYQFEINDECDMYLINFRVFGKCYLAYANSEIAAWSIVISKAREESRNIFGRTGYLDKHKIQ